MGTFNLPPFCSRLELRRGEGHIDLGSMEGRVNLKDTEHRKSDAEETERGDASRQTRSRSGKELGRQCVFLREETARLRR